jgi:hypothetical protein
VTEEEWHKATDPAMLVEHVSQQASDRKLRLIVCQAVAPVAVYCTDSRSRAAIEACELYADSLIGKKRLTSARRAAFDATRALRQHPAYNFRVEEDPAAAIAYYAGWAALYAATSDFHHEPESATLVLAHAATIAYCLGCQRRDRGSAAQYAKRHEQVTLIRHIFGNPLKTYSAPSNWPSSVANLAEAMYAGEACSFALHDALLEAGHPELAEHFMKEQWHPKGCWALDVLRGKV